VLGCLRGTIPKLTRSSLHRCLERHGISRLPQSEEKPSKRGRFAETVLGLDPRICYVRMPTTARPCRSAEEPLRPDGTMARPHVRPGLPRAWHQHRLTKPYHPWTNGQAEQMNRTIRDATVKAFNYPDLEALKGPVLAFVAAYNFAKHLKALRWRTPFEAIRDA